MRAVAAPLLKARLASLSLTRLPVAPRSDDLPVEVQGALGEAQFVVDGYRRLQL
jgi:hypothetical protein